MPIFLVLVSLSAIATDRPATAKEALQPFNDLIGAWKATGTPEGTRRDKQSGFWVETITWGWQFSKDDAWLTVTFGSGKHFKNGTLRWAPTEQRYRLELTGIDRQTLVFDGTLKERILSVERVDAATKETQRLVLTMVHGNRFLYQWETKPESKPTFVRRYQVGATKEGAPFAAGESGPECIVTGGRGTMVVTHKGQTFYVCCTGCRDAFKEDPEKFIKEYESKKKR